MEIFVLVGEQAYESRHVIGVYSSREDAVEARNRDDHWGFDYYYVERRILSAAVDTSSSGDYI